MSVFLGDRFMFERENEAGEQKPRTAIFLEKFGNTGQSISATKSVLGSISNIRVNALDGASEPSVAINPANPKNIVVVTNDFRMTGNYARSFSSVDGGNTFSGVQVPLSGLAGFSEATDPSIAFGADGSVYYAIVHYQSVGNGDGIFLNRSLDGGATWMAKATEVKKNNDATAFEDRPVVTVDATSSAYANTVYVVWTSIAGSSNIVLLSKSLDKGITFSTPVALASGSVGQPDVKVGKNGVVYIAYLSNNNTISVTRSFDGGSTFTSAVTATQFTHSGDKVGNEYLLKTSVTGSGVRVKSYPALAVDVQTGAAYICYSAKNGSDLSDIYLSVSTDGSSWTPSVRVNNDNTVSDQFNPAITAIGSKVYATWQDSRDDQNNRTVATYMAVSNDGMNFVNSKLSTSSFDPSTILLNSYMGDYNGIAVSNESIFAVWTDGRNNLVDVYGGIVPLALTGVKDVNISSKDFTVAQNFPNPFNPSTMITYSLPGEGAVTVALFDMTGKQLATLFRGSQSVGSHTLEFNPAKFGLNLASGNYVYRVTFGSRTISNKLTLLK